MWLLSWFGIGTIIALILLATFLISGFRGLRESGGVYGDKEDVVDFSVYSSVALWGVFVVLPVAIGMSGGYNLDETTKTMTVGSIDDIDGSKVVSVDCLPGTPKVTLITGKTHDVSFWVGGTPSPYKEVQVCR